METSQPQQPAKAKRAMSEKQKAGLSLGLAALKAKREQIKREREEAAAKQQQTEAPPAAVTSAPVPATAAPAAAAPSYVSAHDFSKFRDEVLQVLKPAAATPLPVPLPKVEPQVQTKVVSGSELLDRIFFR